MARRVMMMPPLALLAVALLSIVAAEPAGGSDGSYYQDRRHRHPFFFELLMANPSGVVQEPRLLNVLLVHAILTPEYAADVKTVLDGTSAFAKVDLWDASSDTGRTPTPGDLAAYDAVLVFSGNKKIWQNAATLGDNLADFFDDKGRVVVAAFTNTAGKRLQGQWADEGYDLIDPTAASEISTTVTTPLNILEPGSPLVAGVTSLTANIAYRSSGWLASGATAVARWGDGTPLIVRGAVNGRRMAALNMFPPSSQGNPDFWNITTSGGAIMRNALLY